MGDVGQDAGAGPGVALWPYPRTFLTRGACSSCHPSKWELEIWAPREMPPVANTENMRRVVTVGICDDALRQPVSVPHTEAPSLPPFPRHLVTLLGAGGGQ